MYLTSTIDDVVYHLPRAPEPLQFGKVTLFCTLEHVCSRLVRSYLAGVEVPSERQWKGDWGGVGRTVGGIEGRRKKEQMFFCPAILLRRNKDRSTRFAVALLKNSFSPHQTDRRLSADP